MVVVAEGTSSKYPTGQSRSHAGLGLQGLGFLKFYQCCEARVLRLPVDCCCRKLRVRLLRDVRQPLTTRCGERRSDLPCNAGLFSVRPWARRIDRSFLDHGLWKTMFSQERQHGYTAFCNNLKESHVPKHTSRLRAPTASRPRASKDHINIRILQTMISGFPPVLGLGTRM